MSDKTGVLAREVRLLTGIRGYPERPPHGPGEVYPEFQDAPWAGVDAPSADGVGAANPVYEGVRRTLAGMGLDTERFGSADWNPLGVLVPRGGKVTIKPNMVRHWNENPDDSWVSVVSHWSVVRPLIDYALLAVGPEGRVTVGDAAHWDCNMDTLEGLIGIPAFREHYDRTAPGQLLFVDFRPEYFLAAGTAKTMESIALPGDPAGYVEVDLGDDSMFADPSLNPKLFYGSGYDNKPTVQAHSKGHHKYLIAGSALNCDLFINVPKLKTHHLLGITVAMKNLVGINGDKNYLPHFRLGFTDRGGDQYPRRSWNLVLRYWVLRYAMPFLSRHRMLMRAWGSLLAMFHKAGGRNPYAGGAWFGNDTVWRMTLDLNRILLYARPDGTLSRTEPARSYLTLVDGVLGGEGDGPMNVSGHPAGALLAAGHPLTCDLAAAQLMGFDPDKLRLITEGSKRHSLPLFPVERPEQLRCAVADLSGPDGWEEVDWGALPRFDFKPPTGWDDMVRAERTRRSA